MQAKTTTLLKKLVVLATGGTISGRAGDPDDNIAYTAGVVGVAELLASVAGMAPDGVEVLGEQIAQLDSKDMGTDVWVRLAERCSHYLSRDDIAGVVVTHGTDTMEETAYFLHAVLGGRAARSKPVLLTGAMRPASSASPDGPQNMADAMVAAATPGACGVVVVMAGMVFAGLEVQKLYSYRRDAFGAPDAGPLGYVEERQLRMVRPWPVPDGHCRASFSALPSPPSWPRVEIVTSHAGASGAVVRALLRDGDDPGGPLRGIVVAGTGNGTVHQGLEAALMQARAAGIRVLRASRCSQGRVMPTQADVFPGAGGLSPVKARIRLMLDLLQESAEA
ncbi:MAG: asparaginase [Rhodoferax sp.]|nr:asparaginase [Rhodoferax sp.]